MLKEKLRLSSIKSLIGSAWRKAAIPPEQNNKLHEPPTNEQIDRYHGFLGLEIGKGDVEWQNKRYL